MIARAKPRSYNLGARADGAAQTHARILAAAISQFMARDFSDVTLQDIADQAGVTLQTVLRRFGSKENLFAGAGEVKGKEIERQREPERVGDNAATVHALVASYEHMGDVNWRLLRQEHRFPLLHEQLDAARANHRAWIARCFAHLLPEGAGAERERRIDLLFTVTDVYMWKLMRRDRGLSRKQTERAMLDLVRALEGAFK